MHTDSRILAAIEEVREALAAHDEDFVDFANSIYESHSISFNFDRITEYVDEEIDCGNEPPEEMAEDEFFEILELIQQFDLLLSGSIDPATLPGINIYEEKED